MTEEKPQLCPQLLFVPLEEDQSHETQLPGPDEDEDVGQSSLPEPEDMPSPTRGKPTAPNQSLPVPLEE